MKLTAFEFNRRYGAMVRRKYSTYKTPRLLRRALARRIPPIIVTDGVLKHWYSKYVRRQPTCRFPSMADVDSVLRRSEGGDLVSKTRINASVAFLIRRRMSFLQQLILGCEREKIQLANALYSCMHGPSVRWRRGVLQVTM
jgi:hypothetical protein